jgi:hypothetical protein
VKDDGIDRMPLREIGNHVREEMDNNDVIAKVPREYHRGLLLRRRRKRTAMTIMASDDDDDDAPAPARSTDSCTPL